MATANVMDTVKKWQTNLSNAKAAITAGVNAVTVSPTVQAAAKVDKYLAGVQAAVDSGKFQRSLQAVSAQDWKNAMLNKGLQRLQNGVTEGVPKMTAFMTKFLPYAQQVSQTIQSMSDATESDREQRMLENVRQLRKFSMT